MSVRSSAVSTTCPNDCKRPSKARVVQMVRLRRRTSIARDNSQTILIRCAARWKKEPHAAMDNNKVNNKAISKVINKANSKDSNRVNSKDNKVRRDNPDSKARRVGSRMGKPAAIKMVVNRKAEE